MLPGATVPRSLADLLAVFRPCFTGSSILTGQPEVWTSAARLNEGGP
jgi:hypothetical protein